MPRMAHLVKKENFLVTGFSKDYWYTDENLYQWAKAKRLSCFAATEMQESRRRRETGLNVLNGMKRNSSNTGDQKRALRKAVYTCQESNSASPRNLWEYSTALNFPCIRERPPCFLCLTDPDGPCLLDRNLDRIVNEIKHTTPDPLACAEVETGIVLRRLP